MSIKIFSIEPSEKTKIFNVLIAVDTQRYEWTIKVETTRIDHQDVKVVSPENSRDYWKILDPMVGSKVCKLVARVASGEEINFPVDINDL
jgi:hypothetical protein